MIWCNAKCAALEDFVDFAKKTTWQPRHHWIDKGLQTAGAPVSPLMILRNPCKERCPRSG